MNITRILVPYDFGELSQRALASAKGLAERHDAAVDVLHVVANPYAHRPVPSLGTNILEDLAEDARNEMNGVFPVQDRDKYKGRSPVRVGDARAEIIECARAEKTDLIVMGTHGRTGAA